MEIMPMERAGAADLGFHSGFSLSHYKERIIGAQWAIFKVFA